MECLNWWSYWNIQTWNEKQELGFLGMLLRTLGTSMLEIMSTGKCVMRAAIVIESAGRTYINMVHLDRNF